MVQNLARSPLAWSISGVGAIAATLIVAAYWQQETPSPQSANSSAPELPANAASVSPGQQGKDLGWQAAVAAQSAQTWADWQRVADLWGQAIAALELVPTADPGYAIAQAKAEEYRRNRAIATNRQASASPAPAPALTDLQKALATAAPAFTFAPGSVANTVVGQSADGLATVELADNRATLVLPRSQQGDRLTMAQAVYASQFLSLAMPEASAQPWLLESLLNVQSNRPPTMPVGAAITLSAEANTLVLTVITQP
jgi:hypothetical protein